MGSSSSKPVEKRAFPNPITSKFSNYEIQYIDKGNATRYIINKQESQYKLNFKESGVLLTIKQNVQLNIELKPYLNNECEFINICNSNTTIAKLKASSATIWYIHFINGMKVIIKLDNASAKFYVQKQQAGIFKQYKNNRHGELTLSNQILHLDQLVILSSYLLLNFGLKCFIDKLLNKPNMDSDPFVELISKSFGPNAHLAFKEGTFIEQGFAKSSSFIRLFNDVCHNLPPNGTDTHTNRLY